MYICRYAYWILAAALSVLDVKVNSKPNNS